MRSVNRPLLEVALLFAKLGFISFGGPAAHIALMETETVRKRSWLSREHFLDLLAATNLVPGPNATEMASHIGYVHAGWAGLVVGGLSFTLPAVIITLALGEIYVRFGMLPEGQALFYGINPVIVAIVGTATYRLSRSAVTTVPLGVLSLLCLAASLWLEIEQAFILLAAGAVGVLWETWRSGWWGRPRGGPSSSRWGLLSIGLLSPLLWFEWGGSQIVHLALFFLKVGALLFGSGMMLFAFIQRDIVVDLGWLSQQQLIDAIAVGQMTPGPVLSSATFIGYLIAGLSGALVSTFAVFLPSFIIVALIGPWVTRLREISVARAFMQGVNAAVVAAILSIAVDLARTAITDVWTVTLVVVALILLLRYRVETWHLVVGGALVGFIRYLW